MMIHYISKMASMRAEHFLCFNNSRIQGEGLIPVKCMPVAWAAVYSKAVVLLSLTFLFIVTPIVSVVCDDCGISWSYSLTIL